MKQRPRPTFNSNRSRGMILPALLITAVLGGSLSTASALGKHRKPWARKAAPKAQRVQVPSANVASSSTRKRSTLFKRVRGPQLASRYMPARTVQHVTVRAETQPARSSTVKKKRIGLLARIFKPESSRDLGGSTAAMRQRKYQASPVPNPAQAPPSYNHELINRAKERGSSVVVNIARQRAYVYVGDEVAIDTPVSTARSGKSTPRGSFGVGEKVRQGKISTIYHVDMPYWMRLGSSAYGMHAGYLPGYPASAGCIRMPYEAAGKVYDCVGYGTRVKIIGG